MSSVSNKHLITNLTEFGLNEKEAMVYISLLEFEVATVNQIAKESGVNRSSAYVVLEALKKKGLVSISDGKNTRQYVPTSPDMLVKAAEENANKHAQIKKNVSSIIPDLKALYKGTKQKPVVRVFEGKDGLLSLFEDTLTSKEKRIRVASSLQNLTNIIPQEYFIDYMKSRMINGIKMYGIHPYNKIAEFILKNLPKTTDEQIFIPEKQFSSASDIAIYDNKISFMSNKNGGTGVLIESADMSDAMKNIFDLAFDNAKKNFSETDKDIKKQ